MPPLTRLTSPLLLVALLFGLLSAGCAGAPAQQMSDARQAIRAAELAGAQQHAPELLAEAQQLVERARTNLQNGEYRQARDDAELAREKAMQARRMAEAATTPPAGP
jgi:lipopolysaccharide export LptBFGC system permease protein LptF